MISNIPLYRYCIFEQTYPNYCFFETIYDFLHFRYLVYNSVWHFQDPLQNLFEVHNPLHTFRQNTPDYNLKMTQLFSGQIHSCCYICYALSSHVAVQFIQGAMLIPLLSVPECLHVCKCMVVCVYQAGSQLKIAPQAS